MLRFLSESEHDAISAAADRLIPPSGAHPGGAALGVADYVDRLLGAFTFDPPLIFAGGPFSGRAGGEASFDRLPAALAPRRARVAHAHRRIARPARNASSTGPSAAGRRSTARVSPRSAPTSPRSTAPEQDRRLDANRELRQLFYEHACEGAYGPPEYGGNRDLAGWEAIQFPGDAQPRGYTDEEVSGRA